MFWCVAMLLMLCALLNPSELGRRRKAEFRVYGAWLGRRYFTRRGHWLRLAAWLAVLLGLLSEVLIGHG